MSLEAMQWVWKHSRTKGNARLALLFIADQVRTTACEVRLGRPDFMGALNASKNTVRDAIADAIKSGELDVAEPAVGRRAALYRLPRAAEHLRIGTDSDPLQNRRGTESDPLKGDGPTRRGTDSDPLESVEGQIPSVEVRNLTPLTHPITSRQAGKQADVREPSPGRPDGYGIPGGARPLVDALTAAGVTVRWPWKGNQWFPVLGLIAKAGVPAMVDHAVRAARRADVESAKYFLRGWGELPPLPPDLPADPRGGSRPAGPPHCGDSDCDPVTRTREAEDGNGLRTLVRCPDCHPDRKAVAT